MSPIPFNPCPGDSRRQLASRILVGTVALLLVLLASVSANAPLAAAATASPSVILRAAAAVNAQGKIEVRLRWSLQDGWLPDGGFNLYRFDGSTAAANAPAPLNTTPLGAVTAATAPTTMATGSTHSLPLASLLSKATSANTLPGLSTTLTRGASAQAAFDQLAAAARSAHTAQATQQAVATAAKTVIGTPGTAVADAGKSALTTGPASKPSIRAFTRPAPTAVAITMQARRTLVLSAALNPQVAATLGLAFNDPNVTPGQTYTYRLTSATGAAPLGTVTITVPIGASGLKPAAPTGLQAQQLNAVSVGLRWQRLSVADEATLGVAQYDIRRLSMPDTMAASPGSGQQVAAQGVKLNDVPVVVADTVTSSVAGSVATGTEAASFFTDTNVPVASVTYRVTVTDIFGRTSDPAQLTYVVQDWHKPLPVPIAAAQLIPQQAAQQTSFLAARARQYHRAAPFIKGALGVAAPAQQALVVWTPSFQDPRVNNIWESNRPPEAGTSYQVYRADTEQPNQAPVLLTPTPILPTLIAAAQLPGATQVSTLVSTLSLRQNSTRDALATAACIQISAGTGQSCQRVNPQMQTTLLSALYVYTFTDTGISKDHYYQYFVVAVYTGSSQTSTPTASNVLAYPNLTPPDAVGGAKSAFQTATSGATPSSNTAGAAGTAFSLKNWSGPLVRAPPRDLGGSLTVSWTAGQDDAKYEIYRANAIRQNAIQHQAATSSAAGAGCAAGSGAQTVTSNGGKITSPPQACTSRIKVAAVVVSWRQLSDPLGTGTVPSAQALKDSDFVLLGSTKEHQYIDSLSRSSAEYYVYRIVPLNRWNVPGPLSSLAVRVPATLPPARPKLLVGTPGTDGGVQVEFVPDGDASAEVRTYELWRSTISSLKGTTGSGSVGAAGATGTLLSVTNANRAAASSPALTSSSRPAAVTLSSTAVSGGSATSGTALVAGANAGHVQNAALTSSAARYGVVARLSVLSDAVRAGIGPLSQLTPATLASMSATRVATVSASGLPAGAGSGTWLLEAPSSALDWRNQYVYWVRAVDSDQLHADSDLVDVQPLKVSASAPAGLTASWNESGCRVDLTWQSTDPDTAGFLIERELVAPPSSSSTGTAVSSGGQHITTGLSTASTSLAVADYVQLSGITAATTSSYSDHSAFPNNSYLYRVRTVDQAGNESNPTILATAVAVPDGCGSTAIHQVKSTSSVGAQSSTPAAGTSMNSASPAVTSPATVTAPKPADQIVVPGARPGTDADSATPVASPAAPTVAKPADEIEIPDKRPNQ